MADYQGVDPKTVPEFNEPALPSETFNPDRDTDVCPCCNARRANTELYPNGTCVDGLACIQRFISSRKRRNVRVVAEGIEGEIR